MKKATNTEKDWEKFNRDFKRREKIIAVLLAIATVTGVCIPLIILAIRIAQL